MYKIRSLYDFSYLEGGIERGQGGKLTRHFLTAIVRDKSRELCELLSDPNLLQ